MKKYNFFIPRRLPSMNEIIDAAKTSKYVYARQKEEYTELVAGTIGLTFRFRKFDIKKKVWISLLFVEKNKLYDPDNIVASKKFIMDGIRSELNSIKTEFDQSKQYQLQSDEVGVLYGEVDELSSHYKTIDKTHPVVIGKDLPRCFALFCHPLRAALTQPHAVASACSANGKGAVGNRTRYYQIKHRAG